MTRDEIKSLAYRQAKLKELTIPKGFKLYEVEYFTGMYYAYIINQTDSESAVKLGEELSTRYEREKIAFDGQAYTGSYFEQLQTILNKCKANADNCEICRMISDWLDRT